MNPWFYLWLLVAAVFALVVALRRRHRAAEMRKLAARTGLCYLGRGVPKSLTLDGTALLPTTAIWNLVDGDRRGIRVMAFDCRVGAGKGSWCRTVIATDASADRLTATRFNPDLAVERSGKWAVVYQSKTPLTRSGLMPVDEVEAHLNAIAG